MLSDAAEDLREDRRFVHSLAALWQDRDGPLYSRARSTMRPTTCATKIHYYNGVFIGKVQYYNGVFPQP